MQRCGYCDAPTNDLKPTSSWCYSGTLICPDCRRECPRCHEIGIPEEGDFVDEICLDCYKAENGPSDDQVWPFEHLTRAADD